VNKNKYIETSTILALASLIIIGLLARRPFLSVYIAILFLVIGLFIPPCARIIHQIWFKVVELISLVNSRIILTFIFFFVLTPLALTRRLFKRQDTLNLKPVKKSLFKERNHTYSQDDMTRPW
jgi:hypothetical protein